MKKRIALVVNSLSGGGAERTVSNLSMALSDRYDIDIIVNDREHLSYPYRGNILSLGMPLSLERSDTVYQLMVVAKRTLVLRKLKKKYRYTAVISFSEMCNTANVLSGSRYTRTIISVRNAVNKGDGGIKRKLAQRTVMPYICKGADCTVSCSREIADDLVEHYGLLSSKSQVIYNGLDLPTIREKAQKQLSLESELMFHKRKTIITVGRMTHQKGQWHLLNAVKELHDKGIQARLIILGDGELRPVLEKQARMMGISEYITLPGFVENPFQYLARADVFVMPSLYEGFSNAILEAMACGVPVISTDHETGAREILAPNSDYRQKVKNRIDLSEYGILVPVCYGDINLSSDQYSQEEVLLADALKMVLTDDKLAGYYRHAALLRAEQLDIMSVCQKWIDAIEEG